MNIKVTMYRRLWLDATIKPITIRFDTKAEATSFKLKMYNYIRPVRLDRMKDEELTVARVADMEIIMREVIPTGEWDVTIRPEWMNEKLQKIAAQAGIELGPDFEAQESMKRLERRLKAEDLQPSPPRLRDFENAARAERKDTIEKHCEEGVPSYEDGLSVYDDD